MRVFGVVGWKNAGKTGLIERLVTEITARGFTVSTLKHAHHDFDVDQPGKDSYRHRHAGAGEVLLSSRQRWALMHENRGVPEPALSDLLAKLEPVDLVLVEGYKRDQHPKIEAHRAVTGRPLIARGDQSVVAVASDVDLKGLAVPIFGLDDAGTVAEFILRQVGLLSQAPGERRDLKPPRLKNDCFALPPGVDWVPVDDALARLQAGLSVAVGQETVALDQALDRVLAADAVARRSNPPGANAAVDGFGFAHSSTGEGTQVLRLVPGRAAAGASFAGTVPGGHAVKILTGALLPDGVDTVVMREDVNESDGHVAFEGPVRAGANTREAGEDVKADDIIAHKGRLLGPPELALLSATGVARVPVYRRLRVGVLSTGDEIVASGTDPSPTKTYDANRPMLLGVAAKWGFLAVDLGHVDDARDALRTKLNDAAGTVDVILTSGGASAGDEDHVSALLAETGALWTWRIAVKPGRPLALGLWDGVPIFGLPGNPVAALICTLIFARPALFVLAGGSWQSPQGFTVPAAFEKRKKPGRREYLRARMNSVGEAEIFASEGSGRISGLSWADGLVELEDGGRQIRPGDPVRYFPYASFGL
ncbi:bifunctional molybdopterin-guanine dinucleotide biosynthesis adaptor protein MobB/molybdopterin molybdotransferase MoeA [Rhodobacteraceae bacterium R_SAG10]|jgi:molybdopterin molybdotransferase|nr:bifunctional molybdopterin-guanine dinucleotide biosynthesis adaptor protein MobB/molybdopterin molybdotransferase MoeA [Rhodobacteraceae bacterium R_SAG10]